MTANALIVDRIKNCNFIRSDKLHELPRFDIEIKKIVLYGIIVSHAITWICGKHFVNGHKYHKVLKLILIIETIIGKIQLQNFVERIEHLDRKFVKLLCNIQFNII